MLYIYIHIYDMPRKLVLSKENLVLTDEIEGFIQKKVTPFGTGAKVDCPKKYLGAPSTSWSAGNDLPGLPTAPGGEH